MKRFSRKLVAFLLAASMVVPSEGTTAFAAGSEEELIEAAAEASSAASVGDSIERNKEDESDAASEGSTPGDESVRGNSGQASSEASGEASVEASSEGSSEEADEADSEDSAEEDAADDASSLGSSEDASDAASLMSSDEDLAAAYGSFEDISEAYVAPGYIGVYTEDEVEEYFLENYTEEELCPEFDPDEEILVTGAGSGLKEALKKRETSYSYSTGSFEPKKDIAAALKDTNETDPKGGDYIRGNLIGYYAYYSGGTMTLTLHWASYGNAAKEEKEVDAKVKEIVSDLNLKSDELSEYDKALAIHDYLVNTIKYTNDGKDGCHGTYAALINKKCVCQGYANAFTRLTREAGLASKYITGMRINHAWNLVRVQGGTDPDRPWYNVDITWDDPVGSADYYETTYFLKNDLEFTDHPRDDEFTTSSYVSAHPISRYSWGMEDIDRANAANIEVEFTGVDGKTYTTTARQGVPKLVVFYRTTCYNSQTTIKSLAGSKMVKKGKVDVLAISVDGESKDKIKAFRDKYAKGSKIQFAFADKESVNDVFLSYAGIFNSYSSSLPDIYMIDENNMVQFYNTGLINADVISSTHMIYLKENWDPDADTKSVEIRKFVSDYDIEINKYTKVKSGSTYSLKYGDEICLKGVAIPNKKGIVGFTAATAVTINDPGHVLEYDEENSIFTGISKGTATVTFASVYNDSVKATVKIKVLPAPIKSIAFDKKNLSLPVEVDTRNSRNPEDVLKVLYNPDPTTDSKDATFTTSNDKIVTIEKTGENTVSVKAVGVGTAIITAKCMGKTASCRITTYKPLKMVSVISNTDTSLYIGETARFSYHIEPADATLTKGVTWTSVNDKIEIYPSADGSYCTVKAVKPGNANVSVTAEGCNAGYGIDVYSSDITLDIQGGDLPEGVSEVHPAVYGKAVGKLPSPKKADNIFMGWYTEEDCKGKRVAETSPVSRALFGDYSEEFKLYAGWKELEEGAITITDVADAVYTGAAVKPSVSVYCGDLLLKEGKDYTVSYKNNKNAFTLNEGEEGFTNAKGVVLAPTVTVKGKGNFAGTADSVYFKIQPKPLTESDITVDLSKLVLTENGKLQKVAPKVKFGKTVLKKNKDIVYIYPGKIYSIYASKISDETAGSDDYKVPGQYDVIIEAAKGSNYKGRIAVTEIIQRKDLLKASKLKVTVPKKSYAYTGEPITPEVVVKSGKTTLKKFTDYTLRYEKNTDIGTATVYVVGAGAYTGSKKATFKITGKSISKAYVTLSASSFTYDGTKHVPEVTVKLKKTDETPLVKDVDYTVTCNAINKGKSTLVIKGKGKYTGSIKKTVTVNAAPVTGLAVSDGAGNVGDEIAVTYVKGGVSPAVTVKSGDVTLVKNKDYKLKYSNTTKVFTGKKGSDEFNAAAGLKNAPCITVTGKGNFKGTMKVYYRILPSALKNDTPGVKVNAADVIYNQSAGKWKSAVYVTDVNGKALVAGADYDKNVVYKYEAEAAMTDGSTRDVGTEAVASDSPKAGTAIRAIITGAGAYAGTELSVVYHVIDKEKSAGVFTFRIPDQTYTGKAIDNLTMEIMTVTKGSEAADPSNFEIVPGSYVSNVNVGTAKVTVRGKSEKGYGGTKVVTFKILKKSLK
ncbi:MAG: hypothetical protein K6G10_02050 [Butyrivibrio sp.]|nr:hypothetical protein [Butyrivibrio sp.]